MIPVLFGVKQDELKVVFAAALGSFSKSILVYLENTEKDSGLTVMKDSFSSEFSTVYSMFFKVWLQKEPSKLNIQVVESLGYVSSLLPKDKFEKELPKMIPAILSLYKKYPGHSSITECLCRLLENTEQQMRVGTLTVLRHLISSVSSHLERKTVQIVAAIKPMLQTNCTNHEKKLIAQVICAMAQHGYLEPEEGKTMVEFLIRQCAASNDSATSEPTSHQGEQGKSDVDLDQAKSTLVLCYGNMALYAPEELLLTRIESHILSAISQFITKQDKDKDMGSSKDSITLYTQTISALQELLKEILLQDLSSEGLRAMFQQFEEWIISTKDYERERAMDMTLVLLKYMEKLDVISALPLINMGSLIGQIMPRCADPLLPIGQTAIDSLYIILSIQLSYESMNLDQLQEQIDVLKSVRQELANPDTSVLLQTCCQIAEVISKCVSHEQLGTLLLMAFKGLSDQHPSCSSAAAILIKTIIKKHGNELQNQLDGNSKVVSRSCNLTLHSVIPLTFSAKAVSVIVKYLEEPTLKYVEFLRVISQQLIKDFPERIHCYIMDLYIDVDKGMKCTIFKFADNTELGGIVTCEEDEQLIEHRVLRHRAVQDERQQKLLHLSPDLLFKGTFQKESFFHSSPSQLLRGQHAVAHRDQVCMKDLTGSALFTTGQATSWEQHNRIHPLLFPQRLENHPGGFTVKDCTNYVGVHQSDPIMDSFTKAHFGQHIIYVGVQYPVKCLHPAQADETGVHPSDLHLGNDTLRHRFTHANFRSIVSYTSSRSWPIKSRRAKYNLAGHSELSLCTFGKKEPEHISSCSTEPTPQLEDYLGGLLHQQQGLLALRPTDSFMPVIYLFDLDLDNRRAANHAHPQFFWFLCCESSLLTTILGNKQISKTDSPRLTQLFGTSGERYEDMEN
eukprot:g48420.t1